MKTSLLLLAIVSHGVAAAETTSLTQKNNKMETTISQTVGHLFAGVDARDWDLVRATFADSVTLDFTSMNGGAPAVLTPDEIINAWAAFLPGFDSTHHQISDIRVNSTDARATVHYHGTADHRLGSAVWTVSGHYETELVRIGGDWKISAHTFHLESQSGDTTLPARASEIAAAKSVRRVQFMSDGLVLKGDLYLPPGFSESKPYPAIVVGGSWTTVKEQMSGGYARELAKQGFVTLAFDPRYFGESEGQPRFWENPSAKIRDYGNALTFLSSVPGVDPERLFLTAVCASAGYMAEVAAVDTRVKGLATIAAWLHDAAAVEMIYGGKEGVQARIQQAREAKKAFAENGSVRYIPAVSATDPTAAMFGDFDYYLNPKRGAVPQWSADKFAVMSWEDWLTFNPMPVARKLNVPTLMVHSDGAVLGDYVKRFFQDIPHAQKTLHWTEGTQFDFYDDPAHMAEAVGVVSQFFHQQIQH